MEFSGGFYCRDKVYYIVAWVIRSGHEGVYAVKKIMKLSGRKEKNG